MLSSDHLELKVMMFHFANKNDAYQIETTVFDRRYPWWHLGRYGHVSLKSTAVNTNASLEQFFQTHLMPTNRENNSETQKLPWDETVAWIMDQLFKAPCWWLLEVPEPTSGTGSHSVCAFTGTSLLPPDAQTRENLWKSRNTSTE